jgi:hypothetical protein
MRADNLEPGDALLVQYLENPDFAPANSWATIVQIDERGIVNDDFLRYEIELPLDLQWHGVQVRFVAQGSGDDAWLLDDFAIELAQLGAAPLDDSFDTGVLSPVNWFTTTNTEVVFTNNTYAAALTNNAFFRSQQIPLLQFGFTPAYLRFDAWKDTEIASDDSITVEVFLINNTWTTVATITGSDLSTTPELMQFDLPVGAWALDNAQVRFTVDAQGTFYLDDVYLGTEQLSTGCSVADFAAPFGELNFFDVSAFLSAYNAQDTSADINGDGSFNFFDVSEYLTQYSVGCP